MPQICVVKFASSNLRRQICVVKFASSNLRRQICVEGTQILMLPAGPWPVSLVVAMTYPLDRLGRCSGSNHREQAKSRPGVPESDTSLGNSGQVPRGPLAQPTHKYPDSGIVFPGKAVPLDRLGRFSGSNHREQAKSRPGVPENDTSLGNSVGNRPVPGPARAMRSRMTYPHTPQGTGKRIGTIGERRAQFYFRPNTWSKFF